MRSGWARRPFGECVRQARDRLRSVSENAGLGDGRLVRLLLDAWGSFFRQCQPGGRGEALGNRTDLIASFLLNLSAGSAAGFGRDRPRKASTICDQREVEPARAATTDDVVRLCQFAPSVWAVIGSYGTDGCVVSGVPNLIFRDADRTTP